VQVKPARKLPPRISSLFYFAVYDDGIETPEVGTMAVFTVTTLSDIAGHTGLSLRDALTLANASDGADRIVFASGLAGTVTLAQGQLTISSDVSIDGDTSGDGKADITLSGANSSRVIQVTEGRGTLESLVIKDGVSTLGGGVFVARFASLDVESCTISGNLTIASTIKDGSRGGGIASLGTMTVRNSTIEQNHANDHGGGIYTGGGTLLVENSTISGNSTDMATGYGGGILNDGGPMSLVNVTVSGNSAWIGAGIENETTATAQNITVTGNTGTIAYGEGVFNVGSFAIADSIVLGNGTTNDAELFGILTATGLNIIGIGTDTNGADGFITASSVSAIFGNNTLSHNGGGLKTIMLAEGTNPAVDSATGSLIPLYDARGISRSGGADLGAAERTDAVTPVVPPDPDQPTDPVIAVPPSVIRGTSRGERLDGTAHNDTIYAYGGNDVVAGSFGSDRIYGGRGHDTLSGQSGTDTLFGGYGNDKLMGGQGNDTLYGQSGNDLLAGGSGADTLVGGAGADTFRFDVLSAADEIVDFNSAQDRIMLNDAAFSGLKLGALAARMFHVGSAAADAFDRIIYDRMSGDLSYDRDGSGDAEAIVFAHLSSQPTLSAEDFWIT
jgi:predicted outer membrane repeat protein